MGLPIVSGATADVLTIDPVSKAARTTLYSPDGTLLALSDRGDVSPGASSGMPIVGRDGPIARIIRASSGGKLKTGVDGLAFYDSTEGVAVDTNKWVQTLTTMTITQAVALGILFNAGSSVATTVGAQQTSQVRFPVVARNGLLFRARVNPSAHFNNNLIEVGFGAPATATASSIGNGAVWRKDGSGQWIPCVSVNGGTEILGTPISDADFRESIPVGSYATFEVAISDARCAFRIFQSDGSLVNEQIVTFGGTVGTFGVTRLQAMLRLYNAGATGTAVQMRVSQVSVWLTELLQLSQEQIAVWNNNGSLTSPTVYTQLANYANSLAPVSASMGNTTAGYATLGGQWQFAALAGSETDYALFGIQIPVPFGFTALRVQIDAINTGAIVATTATVIQWGLAFGSSAVSLATGAPYAAMRKAIGYHSWAVGAGFGASGGPSIVWQGREKVQPGRFLHVIAKLPIGTATASQVLRGTCAIDGFFE